MEHGGENPLGPFRGGLARSPKERSLAEPPQLELLGQRGPQELPLSVGSLSKLAQTSAAAWLDLSEITVQKCPKHDAV